MNVRSEVSGLILAVVFGTLIGVLCAFALPALFPGYWPAWVLILGVLVAAAAGGYIGFRTPRANTIPVKLTFGVLYAAVMAILVSFIALFIILNVLGS